MAGEEKSQQRPKPAPESLFQYSKIVGNMKGYLQLSEENLKTVIMEYVNEGYSITADMPVVVMAVVGPPSSGKSFWTNLLLQYYKEEGDGGWLQMLTKKTTGMTGFLWDSVDASIPGILKPSNKDVATSGVYLWPQPFIMKCHGGKQQLIWILHLVRGKDEEDTDLQTLERFLMLACSRVTEIHVGGDDFRILREASYLKSALAGTPLPLLKQDHICDSIVFLFRSRNVPFKWTSITDEEAREELSAMIKSMKNSELDPSSVLRDFKHINNVRINDVEGDLHDGNGCLNLKVEKNLGKSLKHIVGVVTDEGEISPKVLEGQVLQMGDFFGFLKSCVDTINRLSGLRPSIVEPSVPSSKLPSETEEETIDRLLLETSIDIDEGIPNAPLPNDSDEENELEGSFVVVNHAEFGKQSLHVPVPPLSHTTMSELEFIVEQEIKKASAQNSASCNSSGTGVSGQLSEKCGATFSKAEMRKETTTNNASYDHHYCDAKTEKANGADAHDHPSHIRNNRQGQGRKDNPKPSASPTYGFSAKSEVLEGTLSRAKEMRGEKARLPNQKVPKDKVRVHGGSESKGSGLETSTTHQPPSRMAKESSEQRRQCAPMDTTPSNAKIVSYHPNVVESYQLLEEGVKNSSDDENEPMEVDNDPATEAARNMERNEEANRKAEEQRIFFEEEAKRKEEDERRRQRQHALDQQMKKEEEERFLQLELERRQKLDETVARAILQLKPVMPSAAEFWLQNHFTPQNIAEMKNVYQQALQGVLAEAQKHVHSTLWGELQQKVEAECKDGCIAYLEIVQDPIQTFYQAVKKKFNLYVCFTPEELEKAATEEYNKLSQHLRFQEDYDKFHLVELGCEKLMICFRELNSQIINCEQTLARDLMPEVVHFYNQEMKRFLAENVYPPNKLKQIHTALVERLLEAFKTSFKFPLKSRENICETVESQLPTLKKMLVEGFPTHLHENNANLNRMEKEVRKILRAQKDLYTASVEELLKKNPDGLETKELQTKHEEIVIETKKLMEMKIRKVRPDEPLEEHWKFIQSHIDDYWEPVFEENCRNLNKRKQKEEQEKQKRAEELRLAKEKQAELRRSSTLAAGKNAKANQNEGTSTVICGRELPPLVFQLQHSSIKMGMFLGGKPRILKNSSGEESTPFVVGLSKQGEFVYGSEAVANASQDPSDSKLAEFWWVATHFITSEDQLWNDNVQISDSNGVLHRHKITVEFLLAFILKKLKEWVEADQNGTCTTAFITVPFWSCSTQRIQVRNGGMLAGFSNVHLINEASAAAITCASSDRRVHSAQDILIISENGEHFDASVYAYSTDTSGMAKVTMVGHWGSYYYSEEKRTRTTSIRKLVGALTAFWSGKIEEKPGEIDKTLETVKHTCKEALKQADCLKTKTNEVFVISESEQWKPLLQEIGRAHSRLVCDVNAETAAIFGAALLSRNPNPNGFKENVRDKLVFDVLRKCDVGSSCLVIPRHSPLQVNSKLASTTFPGRSTAGTIYQEFMDAKILVGRIQLKRELTANQLVDLALKITNEGIVEVSQILISNRTGSWKAEVPEEEWEWITPNLIHLEMARLQSLLESLGAKEEKCNELSAAKQQLLEKCQELKQQLDGGTVFKIKTSLLKEMFAKKIDEGVRCAQLPDSTQEQVDIQMESLVKWSSKYNK